MRKSVTENISGILPKKGVNRVKACFRIESTVKSKRLCDYAKWNCGRSGAAELVPQDTSNMERTGKSALN